MESALLRLRMLPALAAVLLLLLAALPGPAGELPRWVAVTRRT